MNVSDGKTPLMVASICGGGFGTGLEDDSGSGSADSGDSEEHTAAIITDLLSQGAAINAQTDRTGKQNFILLFV